MSAERCALRFNRTLQVPVSLRVQQLCHEDPDPSLQAYRIHNIKRVCAVMTVIQLPSFRTNLL